RAGGDGAPIPARPRRAGLAGGASVLVVAGHPFADGDGRALAVAVIADAHVASLAELRAVLRHAADAGSAGAGLSDGAEVVLVGARGALVARDRLAHAAVWVAERH